MIRQRSSLTVVEHPLVQHKLSLMRDRNTSTAEFRRLLREISLLLAYEATRELPVTAAEIDTPLERASFPLLAGKKLCLVSILRAGNGILDGMLDLLPSARVGHIGIYRDPQTLQAIEYYLKLPDDLADRDVVLVDPMLATGNSAVAAISRLKELAARSIKFVCLVAAPEGVAKVSFRRYRSLPPPSTAVSTRTATSCRVLATPATVFSARSRRPARSAACPNLVPRGYFPPQ
jgi:uracil phosphoribosyltransferase